MDELRPEKFPKLAADRSVCTKARIFRDFFSLILMYLMYFLIKIYLWVVDKFGFLSMAKINQGGKCRVIHASLTP
ncbi:hypothetical protein B7486_33155 [cyanobacterium TDX16]|nr:hypothetical protein B7486_33155 [cyanobacterium TDX16]